MSEFEFRENELYPEQGPASAEDLAAVSETDPQARADIPPVEPIPAAPPTPPKEKKRRRMPVAAAVCLLLVCALLFSGIGAAAGYVVASTVTNRETASTTLHISNTPLAATGTEGTLTAHEIYDLGCEQVVGISIPITTTNVFGQTSSSAVVGSGFIITEDGYILTNYHVIEYADKYDYEINVMLHDGTSYTATLVGGEEESDVAVIKIDAAGLPAATLGDSDQMQVGQTVYTIGNPLGELDYTMTGGIVSALDREIQTEESVSINMFQIDAAVNSGNSGGPVYDAGGRVIGIVTAKYSESGVEGLGFAIPINDAVEIARQLMEQGYVSGKAYLGIAVQDIDSRYAKYYNIPQGAYVYSVEEGSCAESAGLTAGDVITAVDDIRIGSITELKTALRNYAPGDTVTLTVYRAGTQSTVQVTLDEYIPQPDTAG